MSGGARGVPPAVSWCWLAHLAEPTGEALATARAADLAGRPAGVLQAWPRGRKPVRTAVRVDARLIDPAGPPAWVSLVLVPPEVAPLFDDPAVVQARRAALAWLSGAAISTLVRDGVHFAGAVVVEHGDRPALLGDDPFARVHPARVLRVEAGLFGRVAAPVGPAIERYAGKPWPADGFADG